MKTETMLTICVDPVHGKVLGEVYWPVQTHLDTGLAAFVTEDSIRGEAHKGLDQGSRLGVQLVWG